jgi:hypothetical protein
MVALAGFVPIYRAYFEGTRDIHWFSHVHGGLMSAWLLLYLTQTILAARGSLRLHRTLGLAGVALGAVIWLSMCIASVRVRVALDPPVDSFLWDVLLRELVLIVIFPLFFVAAIAARHDPATHKRFMTLATLVLLQAAIDRLPVLATLVGYSLAFLALYPLCLYALLAPLIAFDLATRRRLHRATIIGIGVTLLGNAVAFGLTGQPAWHELAHGLFNAF